MSVSITTPLLIQEDIYSSKSVQKSKGYLSISSAPGVYNILDAIDKSIHRRKRKVIGQALSDQNMRSFEPTILTHIDIFVKGLIQSTSYDEGNNDWSSSINMTDCCKYLGFDIMGQLGFGQSFELQTKPDNRFLIEAVTAASHRSGVYLQYPELARLKLEKVLYPRVARMRQKFAQLITYLIKTRLQADESSQRDLFSFMADAKDPETGQGFSEQELWSESRVIVLAGEQAREWFTAQ